MLKTNRFYRLIQLEDFVKNILENHFNKPVEHFTLTKPSHPFDLLMDDKRIDVKYSNAIRLRRNENYLFWDFDIRGKNDYCEYFAFLAMIDTVPKKLLFIPCKDVPRHHIRIPVSGSSKWNDFIIWYV